MSGERRLEVAISSNYAAPEIFAYDSEITGPAITSKSDLFSFAMMQAKFIAQINKEAEKLPATKKDKILQALNRFKKETVLVMRSLEPRDRLSSQDFLSRLNELIDSL